MRHPFLWYAVIAGLISRPAWAGDLPDPKLTPGATNPQITVGELCDQSKVKARRPSISAAVRNSIYSSYGMQWNKAPCPCELDHPIPLEPGGSSDARNLWPQPTCTSPWNSKEKDQLEGRLRSEVCAGTLDLQAAQKEIAADWIAAHQRRFAPPTKALKCKPSYRRKLVTARIGKAAYRGGA
jgi:hypothetical protein